MDRAAARSVATLAAVIVVAIAAFPRLIAQEVKPVPRDSVRVHVPGCTKGYIFTAGRRTVDEPGAFEIREGMHLRMNGPKAMMAEIKAHEGSMLELTGLMKKGQDQRRCGGRRRRANFAGVDRRRHAAEPDRRSDCHRCRRMAPGRGRLPISLIRPDGFRPTTNPITRRRATSLTGVAIAPAIGPSRSTATS